MKKYTVKTMGSPVDEWNEGAWREGDLEWGVQGCLFEEGHLARDLHVEKEPVMEPVEEMDVPDRGTSKCKGPGPGRAWYS